MPKWHDHPSRLKGWAEELGLDSKDTDKVAKTVVRTLQSVAGDRTECVNSIAEIYGEANWKSKGRPFYNVWPNVTEALTKVDLSKVMCRDIQLPLPEMMIRFQVGHELYGVVRTILALAAHGLNGGQAILLSINDGNYVKTQKEWMTGIPMHVINCIVLKPEDTVQQRLEYCDTLPGEQGIDRDMVKMCYRLICSICLLRGNPDLIDPSPLNQDLPNWEATRDPNLIELAHKAGKVEWDVGRHIEIAPGFRHPHFAIRWMGKGEPKVPTVRPIKGCIVRKKLVTEVPTGKLDNEEGT